MVRPNDIRRVTTKIVTSARPATKVRQRNPQTTSPTPRKMVMTGNQCSESKRRPVKSQSRSCLAP